MSKPVVFIGGATESNALSDALARKLSDYVEVHPWQEVFKPSNYTIPALQKEADAVDFAVLIFNTHDSTRSREKVELSPRDNVVFEAGLFAGNLGEHRTIVAAAEGTKIPTDFLGFYRARFNSKDPNVDALCSEIMKSINHLGRRATHRLIGYWWQLVTAESSRSVVSLFEIKLGRHDSLILEGCSWNSKGEGGVTWHSVASSLDEQELVLQYSWEGEHRRAPGMPEFFGVGKIDFSRKPCVGSYSSTQRSEEGLLKPTRFSAACYLQAEAEHAKILKPENSVLRRELIQEQLRQRDSAL